MTLQETLDEIARLKGWINDISGWGFGPGGWVKPCRDEKGEIVSYCHCVNGSHPIHATLDSIAALWPEGRWEMSIRTWATEHGCCEWMARARRQGEPRGVETECFPTELEARAALLLAVLRHEKADK